MNIDRRRLRWTLLLSALAGAGWLALFGNRPQGGVDTVTTGVVQPTVRATASSARTASAAAAPAPIERLRPRAELAREGTRRVPDLFAPAPWTLPATRSVAVPTAAPRVDGPEPPPPLPYRFMGKKLEGGRWEVYLTRDDVSAIAREGATLDASYRVDRIEPPTLWLTHLPSGRPQSLAIGDLP
jgi:hypothetical protein